MLDNLKLKNYKLSIFHSSSKIILNSSQIYHISKKYIQDIYTMLKKNNQYAIFFVYCLLTIASCVPPNVQNKPPIPNNPPPDNNNYWFGNGEGDNVEVACNIALKRIASKISVNVNAHFENVEKEDNGRFDTKTKSLLKVDIKDIHFPGYDIVSTNYSGNTTYVIIKVNKKKFLSSYQSEFSKMDSSINSFFEQMLHSHVIEIFKRKKEWLHQLKEAEMKAGILHTFGYPKPQNTFLSDHMRYNNTINRKLNSAKIFIHYNKHLNYVAEHIKNLMTETNIQIVDAKTNDDGLAVMVIDGKIKQEKFGEEYWAKLSINIRLKTTGNKTISQKNFDLPGVSTLGFDSAIKNASKAFYEQAKQKGILEILGI